MAAAAEMLGHPGRVGAALGPQADPEAFGGHLLEEHDHLDPLDGPGQGRHVLGVDLLEAEGFGVVFEHADDGDRPLAVHGQTGEDAAEELDLLRPVVVVELLRDADGTGPETGQLGRGGQGAGRRVGELERARVGNDGAVEALGDLGRQADPQEAAQIEDHLAHGRRLGVDPVDVGVRRVRIVVVDVDLIDAVQALVAGAGNVGAFEEDDGVEVRRPDRTDVDPGELGEAGEGQGRRVVVDDGHVLAHEAAHQRNGQGRAEGVAVRAEVGGHGHRPRRLDPGRDELSRVSAHVSSPPRSAC